MHLTSLLLLVGAAGAVGLVHSVLPDHWVPLAVVGRSQRWSLWRVGRISGLAAGGHVLASLVLAGVIAVIGLRFEQQIDSQQGHIIGGILIATGLGFLVWGLAGHGHTHSHGDGSGHNHSADDAHQASHHVFTSGQGQVHSEDSTRHLHQQHDHATEHDHAHGDGEHPHHEGHSHGDRHDHAGHWHPEDNPHHASGMETIMDMGAHQSALHVHEHSSVAVMSKEPNHQHSHTHDLLVHDHPHSHDEFIERQQDLLLQRSRQKSLAGRLATIAVPFGVAASPDLTILPVAFAATAYGAGAVAAVLSVFSVVTMAIFVGLTVTATAVGYQIKGQWLEDNSNTITSLVLVAVGIVAFVGL